MILRTRTVFPTEPDLSGTCFTQECQGAMVAKYGETIEVKEYGALDQYQSLGTRDIMMDMLRSLEDPTMKRLSGEALAFVKRRRMGISVGTSESQSTPLSTGLSTSDDQTGD